jgi:hypothetical protein
MGLKLRASGAAGAEFTIPADSQIYGIQADDFERTYEVVNDDPRDAISFLREALA